MKKKDLILLLFVSFFLIGCSSKKEDIVETPKIEIIDSLIEYGCRAGDTLNDYNQCVQKTSTIALFRWKCPSGYYAVGNYCWKTGGVLNLSKCGANHTEYNGYCYNNMLATMEYYCTYGKLDGTVCVSEMTYTPTTKYYCKEGYTLNKDNKCQKGN